MIVKISRVIEIIEEMEQIRLESIIMRTNENEINNILYDLYKKGYKVNDIYKMSNGRLTIEQIKYRLNRMRKLERDGLVKVEKMQPIIITARSKSN